MTVSTARMPQKESAAYRAAALIYKVGPLSRDELFAKVHFSDIRKNCSTILRSAVSSGWLIEQSGVVVLTDISRAYFVELHAQAVEVAPPYIGQVATSRVSSAYDRPLISKRNIPNSQGNRDDVPEFSRRNGVRCFSVAGGAI